MSKVFIRRILLNHNRFIRTSSALYSFNTKENVKPRSYKLAGVGLAIGFSSYIYLKSQRENLEAADLKKFASKINGLPKYTLTDVSEHTTKEKRIWVTFGEGVYDITDFIEKHPGGDAIMLAAGGSVEPFWLLYGVHKQTHILQLLEQYRIGNLDPDEAKEATRNMEDPYSNDPKRHPALKPSSSKPFNAEPPPELLVDSFLTPKYQVFYYVLNFTKPLIFRDLFYVRNHLPVPEIDAETYELEIEGLDIKKKIFTLNDIKKLPKHTVVAAIMCAGNRRSEMSAVKPVKGLSWGHAAIGNATWSGPKLYDVLISLGLNEKTDAEHIQFEGLDMDPTNTPYGASIPIEKALDPKGDVILAYEMNGEPLSRDHGFPIRVIVPGTVGARNVKWLSKIIVSKDESESHWQRNDYKGFSPSTDWDTVDFSKSPAIQELPVISAICTPKNDQTISLENKTVLVKGYAWSGGGRKIVRVDVSTDQGKTWHVADLVDQDSAKHPYHWGWTLWTAKVPVETQQKKVEIWAKAVDSSYNTQPETFTNTWNLRGVLSNAYHRVSINLKL